MANDSTEAKNEYTMSFDNFGNTEAASTLNSMVMRLMNLLYAEKGSCRDIADLGVDICSYQFEFMNDELIHTLQNSIQQQVKLYLPDMPVVDIVLVPSPNKTEKYLDIVISFYKKVDGVSKLRVAISPKQGKVSADIFTNIDKA